MRRQQGFCFFFLFQFSESQTAHGANQDQYAKNCYHGDCFLYRSLSWSVFF